MKKFLAILIVALCLIRINNSDAQGVFDPTTSSNQLKAIYKGADHGNRKLKILIVPGHDKDYWGAEYKGVKEADLNYQMAMEIYKILKPQKEFEVIITRDKKNYIPELANYFESQREEIKKFKNDHHNALNSLESSNIIKEEGKVYHNSVNSEVSNRLYGINKWADENGIDLVINIHFNDTPERKSWQSGPYNGFAIYVPNNQFSNAEPSIDLGNKIKEQMQKYFPISNMINETKGVIEDQKLIALGAANTLNPAAILIEYGYIYEPQIIKSKVRPLYLKEMATQTALGLKNFLNDSSSIDLSTLPYKWSTDIKRGAKYSKDVFALQLSLTLDGYYPPKGKTKNQCSVNGNYGSCTASAISNFQKDFGIKLNGNLVGTTTREKLNELYYNES